MSGLATTRGALCSAPSLCALRPTANIQDLHTLTACNLVSLTFSAASKPVLFHTICLSPDLTVHGFYERRTGNNAVITDLKSILSESPHLGELVRVLYVDSDAYQLFYTTDSSGHGLWIPDARVDDWTYFSKVQSLSSSFQNFEPWQFTIKGSNNLDMEI